MGAYGGSVYREKKGATVPCLQNYPPAGEVLAAKLFVIHVHLTIILYRYDLLTQMRGMFA